jgi:aliphatic sulfonates family ABC transporter substrate-binding protein
MSITTRRILLGAAALTMLATHAHAEPHTLRIGYQKNGPLVVLRQQHRLEDVLKPEGISVQWVEFQSGPPMMEALNAGGIDVGPTGDTPPVFAQAAGVDLVYFGYQEVPGLNAAMLVPKDSPIQTLSDLKGRSIAFTKGSSAHYQTVRLLAAGGLTLADVKPVYLQPSDGAAAFRTGRVDAWSIWDPFYAVAQQDPNTRVLSDGRAAPTNSFFLARRAYATTHEAVIVKLLGLINEAAIWSGQHQDELARTMSEITGVDLEAQRVAAARGTYKADFLTPDVVKRQQGVADVFFDLKIILRRIDVSSAVFTPRSVRASLQETPK